MSNYATAVLVAGQAVVTAKNQMAEQRKQLPTVFELAVKNQQYSIPDAQALRVSPLRPVQVNYFVAVPPGTATAKAYNHTGTYGDSGMVELVYIQTVETIGLPRKIAYNSILQYQDMFNNQYEQKWKNLRVRQDQAALAFLQQNRCQLSAAVINPEIASANPGHWNGTNFALEVSQQDKPLFLERLRSFMQARYYTGDIDVISDLQLSSQFRYYLNQGAGNMNNYQWQSNEGIGLNVTQAQIDANYGNGAAYAMPKGALAGLVWNEGLNKKGVNEDEGGPVGTLGTVADPFGSGAIADISMYTQRGDTSSNTSGGSTQDIIDQWEITLTVGYALPPLSLAGDSPVHEIAQV